MNVESIVNKNVEKTLNSITLRSMLNEIESSRVRNGVSLKSNEAQFVADISVIVAKYAVKNATVATLNSISEING